jgi:hypothetical protein
MSERDKMFNEVDLNNKLYIVTPKPMFQYMDEFRLHSLRYPEMVVLVKSRDLNPEKVYYYDFEGKKKEQMAICETRSIEKTNEIINNFVP